MKLSPRSFKIEWDLHAWMGMVSSFGLFVVFYCGVFALFLAELSVWQDPALMSSRSSEQVARPSFDALLRQAADGKPIARGTSVAIRMTAPVASVSIYGSAGGEDRGASFDVRT